jgi:hypothetical protein
MRRHAQSSPEELLVLVVLVVLVVGVVLLQELLSFLPPSEY